VLLDVPVGLQGDNIEFTAKDIEALHPKTLLDVLQLVPGMSQTYQGRQHFDFLSMRGGSFQVILDGVYVSQIDRVMESLPVQMVESMTIVRDSTALSIGPLVAFQSLGSGSSNVGNQGFVIIRTKRAAKLDAGFVSNGGNFGTALGHVYAGSKTGNWDYRGAYTYYNSEGKDRWNMQQRNASATFHGGYTSSKLTMDFMYYGSRGSRNMQYGEILPNFLAAGQTSCSGNANYPVKAGLPCFTTMNLFKLDADLFAFSAVRHWNDSNRTVLQYGFNRFTINGGMSTTVQIRSNEQDSTEGNFLLKHTYLIKKNAITGGGQWIHYIAPIAPNVTGRVDQVMASWFVQDEFRMLGNRLVLDGGIRGDKLHNMSYNTTLKKNSDEWGSTLMTLAFGATYKITPTVNVTARYGSTNSPQATNNVYQTSAMTAPSSSLPNQVQNRGELSTNDNINPHFIPRISAYIYDTTNSTTAASTCTSPTNSTPNPGKKNQSYWYNANGQEIDCVSLNADVKTIGTEVGFSGRLAGPFKYSTGYGYIATDNNTSNKSISHNNMNAGLQYLQKNWFGNFSMVYVGPAWSAGLSTANTVCPGSTLCLVVADYSRLDVNGGYSFKLFDKQMTITAYERNLTDSHYVTILRTTGAYLDPGRQWGVELAGKVF